MPHSMSHRKIRKKLIQCSVPGKILDLIMSLTDENCFQIQAKINAYLSEECEALLVFQVVVATHRLEAFIEVVGETNLQRKVKINLSHKLQEVLKSNIEHTELLANFDPDFQAIITPHVPHDDKKIHIVMFPLIDEPFSIIFCVVEPKIHEGKVTMFIHECSLFVWPTLKKAIALEFECTLKQKCQHLLRVARRLFTKVAKLETLLQMAMEQAEQLTKAEHCSVMLVDLDKMELVDSYATVKDKITKRRFPMNLGITGEVIRTGNLINTRHPTKHHAYNESIDTLPNVACKQQLRKLLSILDEMEQLSSTHNSGPFANVPQPGLFPPAKLERHLKKKTKFYNNRIRTTCQVHLLCFPILEKSGIIGVGRMINKMVDPYFDAIDEEMAHAFSIYCGVCIIQSVTYEKIQEAHIRDALSNELVMYHMKVNDTEVARMLDCTGFHKHPHLGTLHFNLHALPLQELPCYVMRMFTELGYVNMYKIKPTKLARFILYVKKGYRDVPYHSWLHGFNVAQFAFAALQNFRLVAQGYLNDLQALMYVLAGLAHDIDHRGTTNSFQVKGQTTLAALYSSEGSVLERHHVAQTMCILNTEGCEILESLPRRDYDRAIMLLRDYIVATDLANYFKNFNEYKVIAMDFDKSNSIHISALQCLLMNAADLSDQLKDWGSIKKTAAAVLTEFFKQGELEKIRGEMPAYMMDQEKCFIPDLEMQFLKSTCLPLYDLVGKIIPKAATLTNVLETHMERWEASRAVFAEIPINAGLSVLLSPELDELIEQNIIKEMARKEKERLDEERLEAEGEKQDATEEED